MYLDSSSFFYLYFVSSFCGLQKKSRSSSVVSLFSLFSWALEFLLVLGVDLGVFCLEMWTCYLYCLILLRQKRCLSSSIIIYSWMCFSYYSSAATSSSFLWIYFFCHWMCSAMLWIPFCFRVYMTGMMWLKYLVLIIQDLRRV